MNAIAYCRVSSKEQVEGTSLDSQEIACRERARADRRKILKVFIGRGESAKFADRPELLELLEFCRKNKGLVQILYVWKIDRLARNVSDFFNIKHLLLKYGVRVASVTEPIDANPEGKLLETILAGFAQFDNDIRAMRTVQGMKRKLQEGLWPWKAPLGYRSATQSEQKKTAPDVPDETIFGAIKKAWEEFATGAYTKAEMGRLLAHWGVLSPKRKPLAPQSLDNLFSNPYYAGILRDRWSGVDYEGKHVPMVTRGIFAQVQQVLSKRRGSRSKPHNSLRSEFPLRGTVRCPQCKHFLTAAFSKGRSQRYPYYVCGNRQCVGRRSYPAEAVHSEFKEFLHEATLRSGSLERLREVMEETIAERRTAQKSVEKRRNQEIKRLNLEIQKLIAMRIKELVTENEFRQQKEALISQRTAYEAIDNDEVVTGDVRSAFTRTAEKLTDLSKTWHDLDLRGQHRFKQLLLPAGFLVGQYRTAEKPVLISLFPRSADPNSTLVPLTGENLNQIMKEIQAFSMLFPEAQSQIGAA